MKTTKKQQVWLDHIKKCEASKLSMSDYARQNKIKLQQLYQARCYLRQRGMFDAKPVKKKPALKFARVHIQKPLAGKDKPGQCEVSLVNGLSFRFDIDMNTDQIRSTVVALSSIPA